jgi:hypothetical protein
MGPSRKHHQLLNSESDSEHSTSTGGGGGSKGNGDSSSVGVGGGGGSKGNGDFNGDRSDIYKNMHPLEVECMSEGVSDAVGAKGGWGWGRSEGVSEGVGEKLSLDAVIEKIPVGWFHYRLLFICGLAFMADGLEVSLLSFVSACGK